MASINSVVLVGNLTRDPELRHTTGGHPVCSIRLAVNDRWRDDSGEWTDKPYYFDVTVWGNQGEACAKYLTKGRRIGVQGTLTWREWEGSDGVRRQSVEINAFSVQYLDPPRDRDGDGGGEFQPSGAEDTSFVPSGDYDQDIPFG